MCVGRKRKGGGRGRFLRRQTPRRTHNFLLVFLFFPAMARPRTRSQGALDSAERGVQGEATAHVQQRRKAGGKVRWEIGPIRRVSVLSASLPRLRLARTHPT